MPAEKICAVTGASGYVGGRIKAGLERAGWGIVDWTRRAGSGSAHVKFQLGDEVSPQAFAGTRALVHCAYDFTARGWNEIAAVNVRGSEKLLRAARAAGVEQIVFISSISAFEGCRSLYGRAKLEIEGIARSLGATIIRPGLVYGDHAGGVFGGLVKQVKGTGMVPLLGGGQQIQYLVHEEDLSRLVERCVTGEPLTPALSPSDGERVAEGRVRGMSEMIKQSGVPIGPVTLAHEKGRSIRSILEELARVRGKRLTFVPVPWRLAWLGLKTLETLHLPAPFRSDSLIGLMYQNPAPSFELAKSLDARCRPFQATPAMLA